MKVIIKSLFYLYLISITSCFNIVEQDNLKLSNNHIENLEKIRDILAKDIPNYHFELELEKGFIIDRNKKIIKGVNIYNLNEGKANVLKFRNNRVYHISPVNFQDSFSYILIVYNDELKVFKSINCTNLGDSLSDVLGYIDENIPELSSNKELINRIKNYREYGVYIRIDEMTTLNCDCDPCR